jgi:hypothetical protein
VTDCRGGYAGNRGNDIDIWGGWGPKLGCRALVVVVVAVVVVVVVVVVVIVVVVVVVVAVVVVVDLQSCKLIYVLPHPVQCTHNNNYMMYVS